MKIRALQNLVKIAFFLSGVIFLPKTSKIDEKPSFFTWHRETPLHKANLTVLTIKFAPFLTNNPVLLRCLRKLEGVEDVSGSHGDVGISGMGSFVRFKNDAELIVVYLCTEIVPVD